MGPKFTNQGPGDPSLNPQQPVYGLLQADFVYQEDVDSGHPLNLDYFIPINCQTVKTARLSFKLRLYRTYSTFAATTTGAGTAHNHAQGTSASATDTWHISNSSFATGTLNTDLAGHVGNTSGNPGGTDISTAGHVHNQGNGGIENAHTHPVTVNSTLGVAEDVNNNPSYTVSFDGVDQTASMIPAGPYTTDQVEIDVTKFISTKLDRTWHVVSLNPSARGRLQAVLRVLYNSNLV